MSGAVTKVNDPRPEEPINPATGKPWTLWAACCEVMLEAKALAGDVVSARTLMYKVRPLIQDYTSLKLKGTYFTKTILPRYQREVQRLDGVYYEPRGVLEHPHDSGSTPLGTLEVADYDLPDYEFDKILFVEKIGLKRQIEASGIGRKYDMAIMHGQGFSVEAARDLLAALPPEMPKYGLHDGDWSGYNIVHTLGEATERMPNHYVPIIDLGLTVQHVLDWNATHEGVHRLRIERVIRETALPSRLDGTLTEVDLEWFGYSRPIPQPGGKTHYECFRVELNEFSAADLTEFIEAQLAAHGVTPKIVPPSDYLDEHVEDKRRDMLDDLVFAELMDRVDREAIVDQLLDRHPNLIAAVDENRVRAWFSANGKNALSNWKGAVKGLIQQDFRAVKALKASVVELLVEQLEDGQ
jgi:hypothetical protein